VIVTTGGRPALPVASDIAEQHEQIAYGPFRRRLASAHSVALPLAILVLALPIVGVIAFVRAIFKLL